MQDIASLFALGPSEKAKLAVSPVTNELQLHIYCTDMSVINPLIGVLARTQRTTFLPIPTLIGYFKEEGTEVLVRNRTTISDT